MIGIRQRVWGVLYGADRSSQFSSLSSLPKCFPNDCHNAIEELNDTLFYGYIECQKYKFVFINQFICFLINKNPDNISKIKIYINEKYTEENLKIHTVLSRTNGSHIFTFETIFFRCID